MVTTKEQCKQPIVDLERFRLMRRQERLERGVWVNGSRMCAMAAVSGKESFFECMDAGWPVWLVDLIIYLYDANVEVEDEQEGANEWAEQLFVQLKITDVRDLHNMVDMPQLLQRGMETQDLGMVRQLLVTQVTLVNEVISAMSEGAIKQCKS